MANALDTFREQRVAAGQVYAALRETSELVRGLQSQVNTLARIDELKALLLQEERWLQETQRVVAEARYLRDDEIRRLRPAMIRRWVLALVFALASAAAAGAGYAWATHPYRTELAALRSQRDFSEFVQHRAMTMTPTERRQFDMLMRWNKSPKP